MEKPPCVKAGSPMKWCARGQFDQFIEGRLSLPTQWWNGWRIVKKHIVGANGVRFDAERLTILWTMNNMRSRDDTEQFIAKCATLARLRTFETSAPLENQLAR